MVFYQEDEIYESFKAEKIKFSEEVTSCACCEKPLVKIFLSEIPSKNKLTYYFSCPFCGEGSFKKTYQYRVWFDPINCSIKDVDYSIDLIKVELVKDA